MSRPLIGITSYAGDPGELPCFSLPVGYVDCVHAAGGWPVILPPVGGDARELVARLDGLVLAGGGDIAPEAYGAEPHETVYSVSEERDRFEFDLARVVVEAGTLPLLCICRGLQVLNVALGGTLHVHLPETLGEGVPHRIPPRATCRHRVRLQPGSRLARIVEGDALEVLSWHHQGIDRLGMGLRAVGWADDGLVEAVEHERHPWCFGVQWHPEMDSADERQAKLFRALVEAAARRRKE